MTQPDDTAPTGHTRRQFCAYASFVALGTLTACGGSQTSPSGSSAPPLPTVSGTLSGRLVSIPLDSATALSAVGSAAIVQTSLGSYVVAHTGQDSYTAHTATCTHEACTITGFASGRYVCPCHGSQFTTSGAVVTGPATRALPQYPTQVNGNVLSFTV